MHKLGFRTIEEVAEAEPAELAAIPGLGGAERVEEIQGAAEEAMEMQRQTRIRVLAQRAEPMTERERLLLIRGIGERTIELLADAGYHDINGLAGEEDIDRLALNTGLGIRKARQIQQGIKQFMESEKFILEELRANAEAERLEAEEQGDEIDGEIEGDEASAEVDDGDDTITDQNEVRTEPGTDQGASADDAGDTASSSAARGLESPEEADALGNNTVDKVE